MCDVCVNNYHWNRCLYSCKCTWCRQSIYKHCSLNDSWHIHHTSWLVDCDSDSFITHHGYFTKNISHWECLEKKLEPAYHPLDSNNMRYIHPELLKRTGGIIVTNTLLRLKICQFCAKKKSKFQIFFINNREYEKELICIFWNHIQEQTISFHLLPLGHFKC